MNIPTILFFIPFTIINDSIFSCIWRGIFCTILILCKSIWFFSFDFISAWAKVVAVAVRGLGNFFWLFMNDQAMQEQPDMYIRWWPNIWNTKHALVSLSAIILACTISNLLTLEYWFLLLLLYLLSFSWIWQWMWQQWQQNN